MLRSALRIRKAFAAPAAASSFRAAVARLHSVPELPYTVEHGVEPLLSPSALKVIYTDHQTGLVNRLNELIAGTPYEHKLYYEVLMDSARSLNETQIFNNASQAWNNDFFLRSLTPTPKPMTNSLSKKISESFGSVDLFKREFTINALGMFGSGWTWLVEDKDGRLVLLNTYNAGSPHHRRRMQREDETSTDHDFASQAQSPYSGASKYNAPAKLMANSSYVPILCISMWEHAFMTDYGVTTEGKKKYLNNFFDTVDWSAVEARVKNLTKDDGHFNLVRNFNLADAITLCNGACGALSVFSNLKYLICHDPYYLQLAMWCIPLGFTFDVFDGRVARWRKTSSILGQELDSLADAISFGMAPAVLAFVLGMHTFLDTAVLTAFVCCGIARLARYNATVAIMPHDTNGKVAYFEGTPIPTSLVLVAVMAYLNSLGKVNDHLPGGLIELIPGYSFHAMVIMYGISGTLMVSKSLKIPKL
ncbi:CDP-diacylglycerol-serine O-phosphatidyltransferase [Podila humilis]|nr:CDP-diacylglycerol-serine O-phosphatidyltransferase [Podila humilis]